MMQVHEGLILPSGGGYSLKRRHNRGMNRKLWLTAGKLPFSQDFHRDTQSADLNFLLSFEGREMAMNCVIPANVSLRYGRVIPVDGHGR